MKVNVINNAHDKISVATTHNGIDNINIVVSLIDDNVVQLQDAPEGAIFETEIGDFIVLEQLADGTTAVVRADALTKMAFGDDNDWRGSKVRKFLNSDHLAELSRIFGADNIIEHDVDLLSLDGLDYYGTSVDKVSLLTIDQYRKYRNVLGGNLDAWWWLATPDSIPNGGAGSGYVRAVRRSGYVGYVDCDWDVGCVRPFCILKSSIFVSLKS